MSDIFHKTPRNGAEKWHMIGNYTKSLKKDSATHLSVQSKKELSRLSYQDAMYFA